MGIYLPNMEMPKEGCYHKIYIYPDGTVPIEGEMYKAISVTPHGRLIDADAAVANRNADMNWCYDLHDLPDYLSGCPTIIPADPPEEG